MWAGKSSRDRCTAPTEGSASSDTAAAPRGVSAALGSSRKYKKSNASHNAKPRDGVTGGVPLIMAGFWFKPLLSASIIILAMSSRLVLAH